MSKKNKLITFYIDEDTTDEINAIRSSKLFSGELGMASMSTCVRVLVKKGIEAINDKK